MSNNIIGKSFTFLLFHLFTFLPLSAWAGDVIISSPDSSLQVTVSDAGGRLYYSASLNGQKMLLPSALGLKTSIGDLTRELSIVNSQLSIVSNAYQMCGTKASSHAYNATKAVIDIENKDHQRFSIIFQVSNNDIAFRYTIPRQMWQGKEPKRLRIKSELSSFNFPDGVWLGTDQAQLRGRLLCRCSDGHSLAVQSRLHLPRPLPPHNGD